jgi:hypothetical protein
LVGSIFRKFVTKFIHICEKILQICVNLEKWCLVGSAPGHAGLWRALTAARFKTIKIFTFWNRPSTTLMAERGFWVSLCIVDGRVLHRPVTQNLAINKLKQ